MLLKLTTTLALPTPSLTDKFPIITVGAVSTTIVTVAVSQLDKFEFSQIV